MSITLVVNDEEPPDLIEIPKEANGFLCAESKGLMDLTAFLDAYYPGTTLKQWNDWRWQVRNRIRTVDGLNRILGQRVPVGAGVSAAGLSLAVTPYYARVAASSPAVAGCVVPDVREALITECEKCDPLGEEGHSPVPGIVHRYPDRVLFLVTDFCSTHCRYCTRSRMVGKKSHPFGFEAWEKGIEYIRNTPAIRDVLLSGGDPLTLPDNRLEWLLTRLREIPHVEIIRIGSKVPAVLPQRITARLTSMLKKFHPLFISLHFAHPDELTPETARACAMLADAGIPLGSQTVLLKGVNDDAEVMTRLMQGLLKTRVRPYYLYQCDPIPGSSHFRTSVNTGLSIIRALRGHTTGYAVPTYVIDAPGGGGKIPLLPGYVHGHDGNGLVLENYEGGIYSYPDPHPANWSFVSSQEH